MQFSNISHVILIFETRPFAVFATDVPEIILSYFKITITKGKDTKRDLY